MTPDLRSRYATLVNMTRVANGLRPFDGHPPLVPLTDEGLRSAIETMEADLAERTR